MTDTKTHVGCSGYQARMQTTVYTWPLTLATHHTTCLLPQVRVSQLPGCVQPGVASNDVDVMSRVAVHLGTYPPDR